MQRLRPPGSHRTAARILAGMGALAVLTACGSAPATPAPSSSGVIESDGTLATTAGPASGAASVTASAGSGAATTLSGTLQAGVESGCIVLVDDKGAVLANLIGLDAASAPVGSTVEVKGKYSPDLMTTCQQGEPFTVASVEVG
jgi:hypothetical protein